MDPGVVVQLGLRFAPGACEAVGSNPTDPTSSEPRKFESQIFHTLWELKKAGYAESTIETTSQRLKLLAKHCNLNDPESVRSYIASKDCTMAYKSGLVDCYDRYVRFNHLEWSKPYFRREEPIIQLPTEERVNKIISSCQSKNALQFTLLKECGLRPIELHRLTLRYVDLENGILHIKTAKHGKVRTLRLKTKTLAMLRTYVSKHRFGLSDIMFSKPDTMSKAFQQARKRTAEKFQDPEILKVRLYDLRHFYGSMLYHKTKDLLFVKEKLGHRSLSSTMRYMHLIDWDYDEFIVKIASSIEEYKSLLEQGFEYISDYESMKVLRKRK